MIMKKLIFLLTIMLLLVAPSCSKNTTSPTPTMNMETEVAEFFPTDPPQITPLPTPTNTPVPLLKLEQGSYYIFSGQYEKAKEILTSVKNESIDPNLQASADIQLARVQIEDGLCNFVLPLLEPILANESIDNGYKAKAAFFLAECYSETNQYSRAAERYQDYTLFNPGVLDGMMLELAGDAYYAAGDVDNAIAMYTTIAETESLENSESTRIKLGRMYMQQTDFTNAVRIFMEIHDNSSNDFTRAQMNLLAGQSYLMLGLPEQAYARFQESVQNYPRAYDTYTGLVLLVNDGIPVDEFYRGLVDYYAQKYGLAIDAFNRYVSTTPDHNGSAHYFTALSYQAIDQPDQAIQEWQVLIRDHPTDRFYVDAWEDIAYTQWAYQDDYLGGAETLLTFIANHPTHENAAQALYDAGRIYERGGYLTEAAATWARAIDEYPQAEISSKALFLSGITHYRLNQPQSALEKFQRILLFGGSNNSIAAANLWIGKSYQVLEDNEKAQAAWQVAAEADPTGYYSERAKQLLEGEMPYTGSPDVNMAVNLELERIIAEIWMQETFGLPADTNFVSVNDFYSDPHFVQAVTLWDLGQYQKARKIFEEIRETYSQDTLGLFRLTQYFLDIGLYRSAIYSSRQILELANMNDQETLNAPRWFNHVRFANHFEEIVVENAERYGLDQVLLLSLMRQESFFEGFIESSAGARGVMQIMPATGDEIFSNIGWPENYQPADLYIPAINIRYGASYLSRMKDFFAGDMFAALAAYNAGPGNVMNWEEEARNDPDLFLEVIPFEETRRYITNIFEFYHLYEIFYQNN